MKFRASFRTMLAVVAMFAGAALANQTSTPIDDLASRTLDRGREMSRLFLDGDTASAWTRFSPDMQAAMTADALAAFRTQVAAQLGEEQSIVSEDTQQAQGVAVYVRTSRWSRYDGDIVMQWAFDAEGRAAGFFIRPAAAGEPAASRHMERDTIMPETAA